MDSNSYQLGQAIKTAREKAGLTQDGLSDKAGLAYSTLAKIEQGAIKTPSIFTVKAIADGLEVSLDSLLGKSYEMEPAKTPKKQKTSFVYCDVNGVMVRFFHHAFVSLAEDSGVPFGKVETLFWHYNDPVNRGELTVEDFNKAMARRLGVKRVNWQKHYMKSVRPIKTMQSYFLELKTKYRVGLLTNIMPGFLEEMFNCGLLPKLEYDAIVDSSEVGAVKPEEAIYKVAEEKAGVKGSEIFFIDDSRANLTAAEKFGWQVFWFDDYDPAESIRRIKQSLES